MTDFLKLRLGEAIEVKHGYAFPSEGFSESQDHPTLVTPANFAIGGGFKKAKPKTFSGQHPSGYDLSHGDLIISMTDLSKEGDTLGLPAIVPDDRRYLHNQRIGLVKVRDASRVDSRFLGYYLRTQAYRAHILGSASGSTVRHTSPSRIEDFIALIPPKKAQQAIAEALGAIDDKIATNAKIARIADELASHIFSRLVRRSCTSDRTFDELCDIGGGGTPSTSVQEYWDGEVAWATPTDVTNLSGPYLKSTSRTITAEGLTNCTSPVYPIGSILMTSRATIGAFAVTEIPTAVNQGFIVVRPRDEVPRHWILHEMRSRVDEFKSFANGATFLELSRGSFKRLEVRLSPGHIMAEFNSRAETLHAMASASLNESITLSTILDNLLPNLMSGRLQVRDAEKIVSDVT